LAYEIVASDSQTNILNAALGSEVSRRTSGAALADNTALTPFSMSGPAGPKEKPITFFVWSVNSQGIR